MSIKKPKIDPHAKRESKKYENPVPSRECIIELLYERRKPANFKEIMTGLGINGVQDKVAMKRRIRAMLRDQQLQIWGNNNYWPEDIVHEVVGQLFYDRGQLWLRPEGGSKNIKIKTLPHDIVGSGDIVRVQAPTIKGEIDEDFSAEIAEIITKVEHSIVGRFVKDKGFNYVISYGVGVSSNQDILIPAGKEGAAQDGDLVKVKIIDANTNWQEPLGQIIEVLGSIDTPKAVISGNLHNYDVPHAWPDKVLKQLKTLPKAIANSVIAKRTDLRELPFVTIDGEDAKDFDDAVYCMERKGGGWHLYVAIADVANYVPEGTPLDKSALERGTSVYFPGMVVPMLPEILSNDLCSLRPNEDKLVMVCDMQISAKGIITRSSFYEGVIRSAARLTYNEVENFLKENSPRIPKKYGDAVTDMLCTLYNLYFALREQRKERGAIDFDTVETKIIFDKNGRIKKIDPIVRGDAHKIIEECMLCANVATAKYILRNKKAAMFRNHHGPTEEKLQDLEAFLSGIGVQVRTKKKDIVTKDYADLIDKTSSRAEASIIQKMILRSMSQAVYQEQNEGHFGLAYSAYTHFTSPIRRYPDLIIHRAVKKIISGDKKTIADEKQQLTQIAEHCSYTERRADDVTRDVIKVFKCQYMLKQVGKHFDGVVTGVTQFGIFVELQGVYVDGLIHVASMRDDYYHFNPVTNELIGELTSKIYKLGDSVQVILSRVDIDKRRIDLDFVHQGKAIGKKAAKNTAKRADRSKKGR